MSSFPATTLRSALRHVETAWLFTRTDFKTIIFPVMLFATVVSPRHDPLALSCSLCWLWFHLFQFNVSNQSHGVHEDAVNKPWRPLPSGRISIKDAPSVMFTVLMVAHDDFHLCDHPIFKNFCNNGFYMTLELGASLVMCRTTIQALYCSALVILLTIHAQDFADVVGDRKSGRRTLPIVAPEGSRIYMLCLLPLLSFALASLWSLGPLCSIFFVCMGSWVALRYFLFRDKLRDEASYRLYNVRIICSYYLFL
ncbi:uncharacterized protein EDB91DRAFT_1237797 [Suillus paluster]|uniref:uncharacterized protein n=1 Tax=Suillus paluster TaxID=48578 RepID=UPI001B85B769|nr:uncharacterized protein EDB91DRAFT_1237797 [Suillus paluster]KAG1738120.1 hypothetical protein EDB91DRAFT_1237797 [Suillus paluster]